MLISTLEPNARRLSDGVGCGLKLYFRSNKPRGLATNQMLDGYPIECVVCLCFISALTDIIKRVPSTPLRVRGRSTRSHSAHLFEPSLPKKQKPLFAPSLHRRKTIRPFGSFAFSSLEFCLSIHSAHTYFRPLTQTPHSQTQWFDDCLLK